MDTITQITQTFQTTQTARVTITPEIVEQIAAKYADPHQAIVRPEVVMGVSRYFVERWVAVLGTSTATLVNTLRQLTYHNPKAPIMLSGERLAKEAAMSRRHLYKCLRTPWLSVFVRVESGKKIQREGRVTRPPNRYTVRQEDPLTPADAQHLLGLLRELSDSPLVAMRQALEMPPRQLWASSPRIPKQTRFARPSPIFVHQVARYAFPTWQAADIDERALFAVLSDFLHKHITLVRHDGRVSKVIVPQYFRQQWWPLLGHDLAWIYLWLRSRTYENPHSGARRQTCWVPSLNTLLDVIGRPREWWRRNVDHAPLHPEGWSLKEFFMQVETKKGRDPQNPQHVARRFTVEFDIPITPANRQYYTDLRLHWPLPPEEEELANIAPQVEDPIAREALLERATQLAREDLKRLFAEAAAKEKAEKDAPPPADPTAHLPPAIAAAIRAVRKQHQDPMPSTEETVPPLPSVALEERLQAAVAAYREQHFPESKSKSKSAPDQGNKDDNSTVKGHTRAQSEEGVPHSGTINQDVTATSVHKTPTTSTTDVHKAPPHPRTGSKPIKSEPPQEKSHSFYNNSHSAPPHASPRDPTPPPRAAPRGGVDDEKKKARKRKKKAPKIPIGEYVARALREDPNQPFYKAAPLRVWVEQCLDPPVAPGTPAWNTILCSAIPEDDAVALILSTLASAGIRQPTNYLSWLTVRYVETDGDPPVGNWPHFQDLALMPLWQWPKDGQPLWETICTKEDKRLPWGLEKVFYEAIHSEVIKSPWELLPYTQWQWDEEEKPKNGLDKHPGDNRFTAYGVWAVAWNQIKTELRNDEEFSAWFAPCEVVYYADEELYIWAPTQNVLDRLKGKYHDLIVERVSGVAGIPLRVRFVVGDELLPYEIEELEKKEQEEAQDADHADGVGEGADDAPGDQAAPSAPDSS